MRNLIVVFLLLVCSGPTAAQISDSNVQRNDGFDKMSFEVELNKKKYLPLEPLLVTFRVTNNSSMTLPVDRPSFRMDSILKVVNFKGETREINTLTTSHGRGIPLPGPVPVLHPSGSYEAQVFPEMDLNIFAEPGNYKLQFVLYKPDGGTKSLSSNVIEIVIDSPQGINKEAVDFLSKHGKDVWFGKVFIEEAKPSLLKTFVKQYGHSDYGEYAILSLGRYYSYKGEFGNAKAEFKKLESSSNNFLVKLSKKELADIERKKADFEERKRLQ